MPYKIGWLIPKRVYVFQPIGKVSIEEFAEASDKGIELVRSGDAPVHCIGDTRQMQSFPTNIMEMNKTSAVMKEPNLGWFLVLTNNRLLNFSASIVSSLSSVKFKSFREPENLLSVLEKIDTTLPELPKEIQIIDDVKYTEV